LINSLLAIDPGAHTGFASFWRLGQELVLQECGVVQPNDTDWPTVSDHALVVIENPVIHQGSKARPADILKLARIVGRYEERFCSAALKKPALKQLPEPRDWKGTINGDIMCKRIRDALTPYEERIFLNYKGGYAHNALDAIGLGKWAIRQPWAK
jgi:hypothetical protein